MEAVAVEKLRPDRVADQLVIRYGLLQYMRGVFSVYYPGFELWYRTKVIPGFANRERIIHVVRDVRGIQGVSILKLSRNPRSTNKLCSYHIAPEIRGRGVGLELMRKSLREFAGAREPVVVTVPEERLTDRINGTSLVSLLEGHGFKLVASVDERYRAGKAEYVLLADPIAIQAALTAEATPVYYVLRG